MSRAPECEQSPISPARKRMFGAARTLPLLAVLAASLAACVPRTPFVQVPDVKVESVRLSGLTLPSPARAATANLTLQLRVRNPNPFPLRLARAGGRFVLGGQDVGFVELPNVALPANGEARQQADLSLPVTLGNVAAFLRVARGEAVAYRIDGDFTVDAGVLGKPSFGPYTLAQGVIKQNPVLP